MAQGLFYAHSGWRYIVILVAVLAILKLLIGWVSGAKWSKLDQGLGAAFPIVMDIQLLMGIVLWIVRQQWTIPLPTRTWEHPVTMLISIVIAHMAWARVKKSADDGAKFRTGALGFLVAGLIMGLGVMRITGMM